jgi:hypothetical protein
VEAWALFCDLAHHRPARVAIALREPVSRFALHKSVTAGVRDGRRRRCSEHCGVTSPHIRLGSTGPSIVSEWFMTGRGEEGVDHQCPGSEQALLQPASARGSHAPGQQGTLRGGAGRAANELTLGDHGYDRRSALWLRLRARPGCHRGPARAAAPGAATAAGKPRRRAQPIATTPRMTAEGGGKVTALT